jgi:hypothetical protein
LFLLWAVAFGIVGARFPVERDSEVSEMVVRDAGIQFAVERHLALATLGAVFFAEGETITTRPFPTMVTF